MFSWSKNNFTRIYQKSCNDNENCFWLQFNIFKRKSLLKLIKWDASSRWPSSWYYGLYEIWTKWTSGRSTPLYFASYFWISTSEKRRATGIHQPDLVSGLKLLHRPFRWSMFNSCAFTFAVNWNFTANPIAQCKFLDCDKAQGQFERPWSYQSRNKITWSNRIFGQTLKNRTGE